ncbi:group II intron maturase-specific domain-containing protein, partial [Deltaproteobacteria bacterium TL4]
MIWAKSMKRALNHLRELIPRGTHLPWKERLDRINQGYIGWSAYYRMTQVPAQLAAIEAHIRRRLRSQLVGEQKQRRNLFRRLLERGVNRASSTK